MNKTRLSMLAAATITTLALTSGPAAAGNKPRLQVEGFGTYALDSSGTALFSGQATGFPVEGAFTATLAAADGTLPSPGECEPGTGTLRIDGEKGRFVELRSVDEVCGKHVQEPTTLVTHQLTGQYEVVGSSKRPLDGTDGFLSISLVNDSTGGVFAVDT